MTKLERAYRAMSKNIITPDVKESVETADGRIVELATGLGMDNTKVWGVSEFEMVDGRLQTTRRGQMHRGAQSARRHFNVLVYGII